MKASLIIFVILAFLATFLYLYIRGCDKEEMRNKGGLIALFGGIFIALMIDGLISAIMAIVKYL